ncbi:MAG: DsbE family thiol:disulfide interchange protein [Endozoicomonas sp. (ex Botrylloides leachii)]|nr:DsbE family thiol:disulfide interchange protein [Endozoicomonas sp. (ex Botrylloides leachii)]
MRRWQLFLPLILFFGLCLLLYIGLFRSERDQLPSPLLNQPLPDFSLNTVLKPNHRVTANDLKGHVALINVWATWCIACRVEHPYLNQLAQQGITIYGINYKDDQPAAKQWLIQLHNPYRFSINDNQGKLGMDLGVYGAPETYLIDSDGIIRYKHIGIVDSNIWNTVLRPLYEALIQQKEGAL